MARAGVAAHSSSAATKVANHVDHVEYQDVWWARQWDPARQWHCWWLVDDDGTRLFPGIWRLRESSCRGDDVHVIMQYKFQQSVPMGGGSASPSVHRQSVGHYSYVTETGMHSAKLCRRPWRLHRCSSWARLWTRPSVCYDRCRGCSRECSNRGGAAVAVSRQPSTLLLWRRGVAVAAPRQPWTFLLWRRRKSQWECTL